MNIGSTGGKGERLTADYMRRRGLTVIKRNYQCRYGEIDIIAESKEYIIFTEVKTRREDSLVSPAESVTVSKRRKIILTAEDFLSKYETELQPRFDVAEVTVFRKPDGSDGYRLNYMENAF